MRVWLALLAVSALTIVGAIGALRLHTRATAADREGRKIRMYVTGYASCDYSIRIVKACDGITASGRKVAPGTVACGPTYPFGTVFDIVGVGRMTCWDRGGGIQNHMLDVWFPDVPSAIRAGISAKWMEVIVYSSPPTSPPPDASQARAKELAPIGASAGRGALASLPTGPLPTPVPSVPQPPAPKTTTQTTSAQSRAPLSPPNVGGAGGQRAARLAVTPVAETIVDPSNESQPAPPPVAAPIADSVGPVIGRLDAPATRAPGAESTLGNLVADMLRSQYGAHVAFVASRDLRANLAVGPITAARLAAALTPGRKPHTLDLRGDSLRRVLEHGLSHGGEWEGFLHVSGLRVGYNPSAPAGQRLTRFTLANGEAIADQGWYRVALTDGVYFAPGYTAILETGKGLYGYQPLEDMAAAWLAQRGHARPNLDGRLVVLR